MSLENRSDRQAASLSWDGDAGETKVLNLPTTE